MAELTLVKQALSLCIEGDIKKIVKFFEEKSALPRENPGYAYVLEFLSVTTQWQHVCPMSIWNITW